MTDSDPTTEENSQDYNQINIAALLNIPYNPHNYIQSDDRLNLADNCIPYQQNNTISSSSSDEIQINPIYYDDCPIDSYENEEQIYNETTLLLKLSVDRNNIEKKYIFLNELIQIIN